MKFYNARHIIGFGTAGCIGFGLSYDKDISATLENAYNSTVSLSRMGRSFGYAGMASIDWFKTFGTATVKRDDPALHDFQLRTAQKFLHVCKVHGGLYNKFGQYIGSLNSIMPPQITDTLSELQDRARVFGEPEIRRLLAEELGGSVEELFQSFNFTPIGAASIAQVHTARLHDGSDVVVKLQHPSLAKELKSDLLTIRSICLLLAWFSPGMGYDWFYPDFMSSFKLEIDFRQEAHNAERLRHLLEVNNRTPSIIVPKIDHSRTTRRVMTMEFASGMKVNDINGIERMNIDKSKLSSLITNAFGDMIHQYGLVHCDPHPGNLLVRPLSPDNITSSAPSRLNRIWNWLLFWRKESDSKVEPQLVILDHGMYRRLSSDFRKAYSYLMRGILTKSSTDLKNAAEGLGVDERGLEGLALIVTGRSIRAGASTGLSDVSLSHEDKIKIKEEFGSVTPEELNAWLEGLPRDFIWVMRTILLTRCLDNNLNSSNWDKFLTYAKAASVGINLNDSVERTAENVVKDKLHISPDWVRPCEVSELMPNSTLFTTLKAIMRLVVDNWTSAGYGIDPVVLRKLMYQNGIDLNGKKPTVSNVIALADNSFISYENRDSDPMKGNIKKYMKEKKEIELNNSLLYLQESGVPSEILSDLRTVGRRNLENTCQDQAPLWWELPGFACLNPPVSGELRNRKSLLEWGNTVNNEDILFSYYEDAQSKNIDKGFLNATGRLYGCDDRSLFEKLRWKVITEAALVTLIVRALFSEWKVARGYY